MTFFLSELVVKILLGGMYEDSITIIRALSPLPLLVIIASILTVLGLYGLQQQKKAPIVGLTVGIICVVANLFFIPKYGIIGAAIAWACAQIAEILIDITLLSANRKR